MIWRCLLLLTTATLVLIGTCVVLVRKRAERLPIAHAAKLECPGQYTIQQRSELSVATGAIQAMAFYGTDSLVVAIATVDAARSDRIITNLEIRGVPDLNTLASISTDVLIESIAVSPDGKRIATGSIRVVDNALLGMVQVWNSTLTNVIAEIPWKPTNPDYELGMARSGDHRVATTASSFGFDMAGDTLYAYGDTGYDMCVISNIGTTAPEVVWKRCKVKCSRRAVDQSHSRVASPLGVLYMTDLALDADQQQVIAQPYSPGSDFFWGDPGITIAAWSAGGRFLFTQSAAPWDCTVWDMTTGESLYRDVEITDWSAMRVRWITAGAIDSAGSVLALGTGENENDVPRSRGFIREVRLYDVAKNCSAAVQMIAEGGEMFREMRFSTDGKYLLVHLGVHASDPLMVNVDPSRDGRTARSRLLLYEISHNGNGNSLEKQRCQEPF